MPSYSNLGGNSLTFQWPVRISPVSVRRANVQTIFGDIIIVRWGGRTSPTNVVKTPVLYQNFGDIPVIGWPHRITGGVTTPPTPPATLTGVPGMINTPLTI